VTARRAATLPVVSADLAELYRLRAENEAFRAAFQPRSAERDAWQARVDAAWRDGYQAAAATWHDIGYGQACAEMARAWHEAASPIAHGPFFADLERRRWSVRGEPRTRETFRHPHPSDYRGGPLDTGAA